MKRILTTADVVAAVKGGSVFAAGGGGWADHGTMLGMAATNAGQPEMVTMDEVPDDAWIATAAAIGAPAGTTDWQMLGIDYVKAVTMLQEALGAPIYGLIIGQNGMSSTLNAWLPSALLGTKVIDAVGDVRAHPTGDMGSLGLTSSPEVMIQTAVGGNRAKGQYIELTVRGASGRISPILRTASDMSGGFIASCRNPVRAGYVRQHAALGGISLALSLGEAIIRAEPKGGGAVIDAICESTGGRILFQGKVIDKSVVYTNAAFDVGTITLERDGKRFTLHIMNEYMAAEDGDGQRLSTWPDVLTTLDTEGRPVSVGKLHAGDELLVFCIDRSKIPLSTTVDDPGIYPVVEKALGIDIARYAMSKDI